jgi:flagellar basal body-associated protein FliL|tara:strand:+ start:380 stop:631 length:252 start_codon:yes stop_codon:yes gene_type:complete
MDVFNIVETLGVPVAVALGLAYALMYLIRFVTKDVSSDLKRMYDIIVKLIDSNREAKDEVKKTMTATNAIKDIVLRLFKKGDK